MENVLLKNDNVVINFVGTGEIDGKNVEVRFKAAKLIIDQEDRGNPKIIIIPILEKPNLTYMQINTHDEDKL